MVCSSTCSINLVAGPCPTRWLVLDPTTELTQGTERIGRTQWIAILSSPGIDLSKPLPTGIGLSSFNAPEATFGQWPKIGRLAASKVADTNWIWAVHAD